MDYPSMENVQQRHSVGEYVCPKCETAITDLSNRPGSPHQEISISCPECGSALIVFYAFHDFPDNFSTTLVTPEYREYCRQLDLFWSGF